MRYMSVAREQPPVERIVRPFQDFADKQSSGGILLIIATAVALVWANSPWAESYVALWHTKLSVGVEARASASRTGAQPAPLGCVRYHASLRPGQRWRAARRGRRGGAHQSGCPRDRGRTRGR